MYHNLVISLKRKTSWIGNFIDPDETKCMLMSCKIYVACHFNNCLRVPIMCGLSIRGKISDDISVQKGGLLILLWVPYGDSPSIKIG